MLRIVAFCEDYAHRAIVDAVVRRVAAGLGQGVELGFRSATGGHSAAVARFSRFVIDLHRQKREAPDMIVVVTDSNCRGNLRRQEVEKIKAPVRVVHAIPDPHIERWLLLDNKAFKQVAGRGCRAPDRKCGRDRYKKLLSDALSETKFGADFDGFEFAMEISRRMDIRRVMAADRSFDRFIRDLRAAFRVIGQTPRA